MNKPILIIFCLVLIYGCRTDDALFDSHVSGRYSYQAFDSLGVIIVDGWLIIEAADSDQVEGAWQLTNLKNRDDIGLLSGSGELVGNIKNTSIFINLNPGFADHNVYLNGTIESQVIEGEWIWATFIGPTNHGTFKARKN